MDCEAFLTSDHLTDHCNCFLRALLCAGSAVSALLLVDNGHVVFNSDCAGWTVLFTDVTSDTTDCAILVNELTHILGLAGYYLCCIIWDKVNEVARADIYALAAGLTLFLINNCNAVNYVDGIELAD